MSKANPLNNLLQNRFLCVLFLGVLVFSAYSFVLEGTFKTMDDEASIVNNDDIKSFAGIPQIFSKSFFGGNSYYRPLVSFSFMLEHHFFGLDPFYYYLTNICIHFANVLTVMAIMHLLLGRLTPAFMASLLFAIHPIQWEAVSNIPGRAILLCAFWGLLTVYFFIRAEEKRWAYFASLVCFVLALLSKESAGVLPLVLLTYRFLLKKTSAPGLLPRLWPVAPYFIAAMIYVLIRRELGITNLFYWRSVPEALLGLVSFLRSLITHARLLVFPVDLQFDRSRPVFLSFVQPEAAATILIFAALVMLLWRMRRQLTPLIIFLGSWVVIEFLPVSQFLVSIGVQPGYISTAEHFLYMPSVGIFALVVLGGQRLMAINQQRRLVSPELIPALLVAFMAFFFATTIQHNIYSSNEVAMFERTLAINPGNLRIRNSLAYGYARLNRFDEAEKHYRLALGVDPLNVRSRIGLGKALCDQGKYWDGVREYEKINDPGDMRKLWTENISATYRAMRLQYEAWARREPDNPQVRYTLGVIYSKLGELDLALVEFEKAVALKPDYADALFNLASASEAKGDFARAIEFYEKMLAQGKAQEYLLKHAYGHLRQIHERQGIK